MISTIKIKKVMEMYVFGGVTNEQSLVIAVSFCLKVSLNSKGFVFVLNMNWFDGDETVLLSKILLLCVCYK